jgi:hypothetical protein
VNGRLALDNKLKRLLTGMSDIERARVLMKAAKIFAKHHEKVKDVNGVWRWRKIGTTP